MSNQKFTLRYGNPGRPMIYAHLIKALDDETLYSAASVVKAAKDKGILSQKGGGAERGQKARNALVRFSQNHFSGTDGIIYVRNKPSPAWFGWRWKLELPKYHLPEHSQRHLEKVKALHQERLSNPHQDAPEAKSKTTPWFQRMGLGSLLAITLIAVLLNFITLSVAQTYRIDDFGKLDEAQLRLLLTQREYDGQRPHIAALLANFNSESLLIESTSSTLAVFAFKDDPLLVYQEGFLRLGSWVNIEGWFGYVAEITRYGLLVKTGSRSVVLDHPIPNLFDKSTVLPCNVLVYGQDNLQPIIEAITETQSLELYGQSKISGVLSGQYNVSGFSEFLHRIGPYTGIELNDQNILVEKSPQLRSYIGFDGFTVLSDDRPEILLQKYHPYLGYPVVANFESKEPVAFTNLQFVDLIRDLNLVLSINGNKIVLKEREAQGFP